MKSYMEFHGGSRDGVTTPTREGFPAPDGCVYAVPGRPDVRELYEREDSIRTGSGEVTHVYQYVGREEQ